MILPCPWSTMGLETDREQKKAPVRLTSMIRLPVFVGDLPDGLANVVLDRTGVVDQHVYLAEALGLRPPSGLSTWRGVGDVGGYGNRLAAQGLDLGRRVFDGPRGAGQRSPA